MSVSGFEVDKLLADLKLDSRTGSNQVGAVVVALQELNKADRLAAKSFDTTSSNTGNISGARPSSSKSRKNVFYS